ncbi:hypothetical protein Ancab_010182 [Ancistrocladus abbreviatus]
MKQKVLDCITTLEENDAKSNSSGKKEKKKNKSSSISRELKADESNGKDFSESKKSKKRKKEKKRKPIELDDSERSETSLELQEPVNTKAISKKGRLMESASSGDEEEGKIEEKNPNAVSNFRTSKPLRDALKSKGIESLFPFKL